MKMAHYGLTDLAGFGTEAALGLFYMHNRKHAKYRKATYTPLQRRHSTNFLPVFPASAVSTMRIHHPVTLGGACLCNRSLHQ